MDDNNNQVNQQNLNTNETNPYIPQGDGKFYYGNAQNTNSYQQNNYGQNGYRQTGYQQNNYQQAGYQQNNYQPGYQQNAYQQNGYTQYNYQQTGYQQNATAYDNYYGTENVTAETVENVKPAKKGSGFLKFLRVAALALVFGILAGGSFYGINRLMNKMIPGEANNTNPIVNPASNNGNETNVPVSTVVSAGHLDGTCVSDIVDKSMGFTVAVNCTFTTSSWFGQYTSAGSGTGIIVGTNETELLIVTNNHVVDSAKTIEVVFVDGNTISALEKGTDSNADLAVIAVKLADIPEETMKAINFATLGDSDEVRVGEMVVAIGNALGYGQSVTVGYISAKNREVTVDNVTMTLLQTDAAINPGNSGGALVNLKGEVIGINSVKYAEESVEGMGFSIPVSNVKDIIERLMNALSADEKGYLGVYIYDITEDLADYYNWPVGVYIKEFTENSAAEAAGLQIRDIITAINGVKVKSSDEMISLVTSNRYGTVIKVEVQRNVDGTFQTFEYSVTLGKNTTVNATPTPTPRPGRR